MQVKLLTSWAGDDFTWRYGQVVDLPEEVAIAHIAAGNAESAEPQNSIETPQDPANEDPKPETKKKK